MLNEEKNCEIICNKSMAIRKVENETKKKQEK